MKVPRLQHQIIYWAIVFAFCVLVLPEKGLVQTDCQPPGSSPLYAWPKDAQVRINIDPSFTDAEKQGIQTALANWNSANGATGNNSGVTFLMPPTFNSTPTSGVNTMQVTNQPPPSCQTCPGTSGGTYGATSRESSLIYLNGNSISVSSAWQASNIMAHEVGHSFGLDNCETCICGNPQGTTQDDSVMSVNCGQGQGNSPQGPTACDNAMVNQVGNYGSGGGSGGCESIDADGDGWNSCVDCNDNDYDPSNNCDPGDPGGSCYPDPCGCTYYHGYVYYYNDYDECWEKHEVEQYVCNGQVMWQTDTYEGCYYE